jgi:SAM-dependent methyltransferase
MSTFETLIRRQAEIKFGAGNERPISEWVEYWRGTAGRNRELVKIFAAQIELSLGGKMLLDIGCGTGGLAALAVEGGGFYVGVDYYSAILEMAQALLADASKPQRTALLRASGISLPLRSETTDIVTAFDVIEHLVGGEPWQQAFLREIRRVLRPGGIVLLTTPNRLHPFEPHTQLYGPHYLPVSLADRYIRWRNPSFLREYPTYGEIHLLTPWKMKSLLETAGLRLITDLPLGLPLERYAVAKRMFLRGLAALGLGWFAPSQFWIAACRAEDRARLREKAGPLLRSE